MPWGLQCQPVAVVGLQTNISVSSQVPCLGLVKQVIEVTLCIRSLLAVRHVAH
jgi:hypothetical protein